MATDLLSALKTYLTKLGNGEKTPQELAAALNSWARESGEALKSRVEEEVKRNVSKMGFAKESDLQRLENELAALRREFSSKAKNKPSQVKKPVIKKVKTKAKGSR